VRAAPHLAQARSLGASNALAQLQLGLLALRLRDAATAETHFRAAIDRDAGAVEALHGLALACRAQRKSAEAESALREAIAHRFHFPRAHHQLGLVLADQGRLAEATHAIRTAVQQDPALKEAEKALQRLVQAQIAGGRASPTGPA
jgi:Tfp pilus assembly protein PilF